MRARRETDAPATCVSACSHLELRALQHAASRLWAQNPHRRAVRKDMRQAT